MHHASPSITSSPPIHVVVVSAAATNHDIVHHRNRTHNAPMQISAHGDILNASLRLVNAVQTPTITCMTFVEHKCLLCCSRFIVLPKAQTNYSPGHALVPSNHVGELPSHPVLRRATTLPHRKCNRNLLVKLSSKPRTTSANRHYLQFQRHFAGSQDPRAQAHARATRARRVPCAHASSAAKTRPVPGSKRGRRRLASRELG